MDTIDFDKPIETVYGNEAELVTGNTLEGFIIKFTPKKGEPKQVVLVDVYGVSSGSTGPCIRNKKVPFECWVNEYNNLSSDTRFGFIQNSYEKAVLHAKQNASTFIRTIHLKEVED